MAGIQRLTPSLLRVLATLLSAHERGEQLYGIQVVNRAQTKQGAVSPMLDKLEEDGWIEADWDPPSCPARVRHPLYRLTEEGVHAARRFRDEGVRWFSPTSLWSGPEPGGGPPTP